MKRFFAICLASTILLTNNINFVYASSNTNYSSGTDYSFDVNKAFDADLYYARSILNNEGKKAWDVALDTLLSYDNSDNKYTIKDGNAAVTINYKELGINIDKTQAQYVQKYLVRQEPRMYLLKDWGATVKLDSNGMVETQTFYVGNGVAYGDSYQKQLLQIDAEANKLLTVIKDDMTIYQKIQAIQKAFESSVKYENSGSPGDLRGAFLNKKAICGGYSKGFEYLLLKLGIQNIWVNGYTYVAHAWNYVNIDNKWYLMDTTWGGVLGYLKGESSSHMVYDTYHIMPTLEKEGISYKLGTYPGVWIDTPSQIILPLNADFNPSNYIRDLGDIYDSDLSGELNIIENTVDTSTPGVYNVVYEVTNKDGNKATADVTVTVVDGKEIYVNQLENLSGNLRNQNVSLYINGKEKPFSNGLFGGESVYAEYNVEGENAKYFEANVGINKSVRDNVNYGHYGKVQFEVYADDTLIYQSSVLGWKDNYETISVEIPQGTKTLKLVNVPKGGGNNHGAWGDAKIITTTSEFDKELNNLQQLIDFSEKITDTSYVLVSKHQEMRFKNLVYAREYAKESLNNENISLQDIKNLYTFLLYSVEELGQVYEPGLDPVSQ